MTKPWPEKLPKLTASVLLLTGLLTGLQFVIPGLLGALQRTPMTRSSHEWWRLITPFFINRGTWKEITFNLVSLAIVGTIAERVWGGILVEAKGTFAANRVPCLPLGQQVISLRAFE